MWSIQAMVLVVVFMLYKTVMFAVIGLNRFICFYFRLIASVTRTNTVHIDDYDYDRVWTSEFRLFKRETMNGIYGLVVLAGMILLLPVLPLFLVLRRKVRFQLWLGWLLTQLVPRDQEEWYVNCYHVVYWGILKEDIDENFKDARLTESVILKAVAIFLSTLNYRNPQLQYNHITFILRTLPIFAIAEKLLFKLWFKVCSDEGLTQVPRYRNDQFVIQEGLKNKRPLNAFCSTTESVSSIVEATMSDSKCNFIQVPIRINHCLDWNTSQLK